MKLKEIIEELERMGHESISDDAGYVYDLVDFTMLFEEEIENDKKEYQFQEKNKEKILIIAEGQHCYSGHTKRAIDVAGPDGMI